eukprot:6194481-Pleurochrysis_carterae.AAC.1
MAMTRQTCSNVPPNAHVVVILQAMAQQILMIEQDTSCNYRSAMNLSTNAPVYVNMAEFAITHVLKQAYLVM